MTLTIAIVAPGAMGSAVGARLVSRGAEVLTSLDGRGHATKARAEAAGMRHAEDREIAERASFILSIVPPAAAPSVAERFAPLLGAEGAPIYADCNAISLPAMTAIAALIEGKGGRCVDGGIIGAPPKGEGKGPGLHFSGAAAPELAALGEFGLDARIIDGPVGAATALKLSYAGVAKGVTALGAAMILAADRAGAGGALRAELADSLPALLARLETTLPDMYPKAYRWVEEMRAIADFVGPDFPESQFFKGAAGLFERLASDVAGDGLERSRIDSFLGRS